MGVAEGFSSATIRECACGADAGGIDCDGGFCSESLVFGARAVDALTVATSNKNAGKQRHYKRATPNHCGIFGSLAKVSKNSAYSVSVISRVSVSPVVGSHVQIVGLSIFYACLYP